MPIVRQIFSTAARILGALLIVFASLTGTALYFNAAPSKSFQNTRTVSAAGGETNEIRMELREGESAASIGVRLEEAALIKNHYVWQIICRLRPDYLKAGIYQFAPGLSLLELHRLFTSGAQVLTAVTIPEGSTIRKTAELLEKAGVCSAEDFISAAFNQDIITEYAIPAKSLEGYLYPDTYYFNLRYPANLVARTMADTFFKRLRTFNNGTARDPRALFNTVILASIIEREYRIADEAPVIAGVFQNRLQRGMKLESCATIVYIITEIEGKPHPQRLLYRDLEQNNPYNTYIYQGLPPGPIASPGALALNAALNPEATGYLFFRVTNPAAGRHYFSKTFDDHIKAGALLVK